MAHFSDNVYATNLYGVDLDENMGSYTEAVTESWKDILLNQPPPDPLPDGWILHRSRSQPGYVYYWNQFTGECTWDPPFLVTALAGGIPSQSSARSQAAALSDIVAETLHSLQQHLLSDPEPNNIRTENMTSPNDLSDTSSTVMSILKKNNDIATNANPLAFNDESLTSSTTLDTIMIHSTNTKTTHSIENATTIQSPETKKQKLDSSLKATTTTTTTTTATTTTAPPPPEQVHVLHILKKHKDSRRPSSWRVPKITISKEKAREELQELLDILHESIDGHVDELRATFEELAKTESDCSSAKRGGDLGWFGRKKMQPAFEDASFSLQVGELSSIVDTSSGMHILLRLG